LHVHCASGDAETHGEKNPPQAGQCG
jgi:hypothetical protein